MPQGEERALIAVGDLHVEAPGNRRFVETLQPIHDGDWLIVCGDVGVVIPEVEWALRVLAERFEMVIWVPGNHELWALSDDPVPLRGDERYRYLVCYCKELGIATPEDPYPEWTGPGGPAIIAPLFTLYDYSFGINVAPSKRESLERAYEAGVVCSDELVLFPEPFPSREAWCRERVQFTEERLAGAAAGGAPLVLVDHFPLLAELTQPLFHPEFAQWCGTLKTADWHRRFGAVAVVYGHLHIPRSTVHDGVRFYEVSLGYPHEWSRRGSDRSLPRTILPEEVA